MVGEESAVSEEQSNEVDLSGFSVEDLLRQSYLLLRRDETREAEHRCRLALEREPENAEAHELLGDVQRARGFFQDSISHYRRALELRPDRPAVEEKIARAALGQFEDARERAEAESLIHSPAARAERRRAGLVAVLLSVVCPGAGQVIKGERVKGAILLLIYIAGVFLGGAEMFKMILAMAGALPRGETYNGMMATLGMAGLLAWLYALLDAASMKGRQPLAGDV